MNHGIHWALNLDTAATGDVVTLAEAKLHLRVDAADEDALIQALIDTAVEHAQDYTGRQLLTATWDYILDRFPHWDDVIKLPLPPVASVTSVTYIDTAGDTQTLANTVFAADVESEPARIYLLPDQIWPTTRDARASVTIKFIAGYGVAADVPNSIKQAILLMVGHWYENREEVIIGTISGQIPVAADMLLLTCRTPGLE